MNDIAASVSSEGLLLRPLDLWRLIWSDEGLTARRGAGSQDPGGDAP
jgi:hypothetical protein